MQTPDLSHRQELARLGFTKGDPFATLEADQERGFLEELFVDIKHFERIRSARTVIVHAPRGCGKSAARVRLASSAAPWIDRTDIDTFAIEFLSFDDFARRLKAGETLTALDYVDAILAQGAKAAFGFLFTPNPLLPRLERLAEPDLARLGRLIWQFAPDTLLPEEVLKLFNALLPNTAISWTEINEAVRDRRVKGLIGKNALAASRAACALAFLLDLEPENRRWNPQHPVERINPLVQVVQSMGFPRLAVLVDRVDEIHATTSDYGMQADLLEPLLSNLQLMEMPGVSFKFFVPTETRDLLLQRESVRIDRLDIMNVTLDWDKGRLRDLLKRRLEYFTDLPDLSQFVSARPEDQPDGDERLSEAIEREMIAIANHSPRRLIQAGQKLLDAYAARPNADRIIWADWLTAKRELLGEGSTAGKELETQLKKKKNSPARLSTLFISLQQPFMWLKGHKIHLTDTERNIIQALLSHEGSIRDDDLSEEVWGEDAANDAAIDVNLKRIRDRIDEAYGEKKIGLTFYLMKRSGTIVLSNYEVCEQEPPKESQ